MKHTPKEFSKLLLERLWYVPEVCRYDFKNLMQSQSTLISRLSVIQQLAITWTLASLTGSQWKVKQKKTGLPS